MIKRTLIALALGAALPALAQTNATTPGTSVNPAVPTSPVPPTAPSGTLGTPGVGTNATQTPCVGSSPGSVTLPNTPGTATPCPPSATPNPAAGGTTSSSSGVLGPTTPSAPGALGPQPPTTPGIPPASRTPGNCPPGSTMTLC